MDETSILQERLWEAQQYIETIGDKLLSERRVDQYEACALLFLVREAAMDVLDNLPIKNVSIDELLMTCETDDITFFSGMVNNLFQEDTRAVYAVSTYYTRLIGRLIWFLQLSPEKQKDEHIEMPDFDPYKVDIIGEAYDDNEAHIRQDIIDIQNQLNDILCILGKWAAMTYAERYEASMEIVRIREYLFNIFREVRHYKLSWKHYHRGALMEKAFIEDIYKIDEIIPGIIEDGESHESIQLVQRLIDFSHKIERFLASSDASLLAWPFVSIVPQED